MAPRVRDEQRQRIIELRLNRVPVRTVAAEVGVSLATVVETFKSWLETESPGATQSTTERSAEALARLDQVATDARRGAVAARAAGDHGAAARYLSVESRTLALIAQLEQRAVMQGSSTTPQEVSTFDEIAQRREQRIADTHTAAPARRGS